MDISGLGYDDKQKFLMVAEAIKEEASARMGSEYPEPEEKLTLYSLFKGIFKDKDNAKTGNVTDPELNATRIYIDAANYAEVMDMDYISEFLRSKAQVIFATSLSKKGFSIKALQTTKKEFSAKAGGERKSQGLFRKKEQDSD